MSQKWRKRIHARESGHALNEIAKQDKEILNTVIEVMEAEKLIASGAALKLFKEALMLLT